MADTQKQFEEFHQIIRLSADDGKAILAEKRDIIEKDLKAGLKKRAEENDEDQIGFSTFQQGSYAMNTGTVPANGDYDIDVGILLEGTEDTFPDPVGIKTIIRDAINSSVRTVTIRRPCVTVNYIKNGEVDYHVDLAIYVQDDWSDCYKIAFGREFSSDENKHWQISDPIGLKKAINDRVSDDGDRKQYRRVIRYLKRWRDMNFTTGSPPSIALTVAAYHWFSADTLFRKYRDLRALERLVQCMLDSQGFLSERMKIKLPVEPYNDLLDSLTDAQMESYRGKLEKLHDALVSARDDDDLISACKTLKKVFGDDFPVPEDDDPEGKKKKSNSAGYITTGSSA